MVTPSGWPVTWPPVVWPVPPPCSSSTLSTMPGKSWQFLLRQNLLADMCSTRLANDAKSAGKGGERQFNGLVDVYRKTLASDGIGGLYRGFGPSVLGIVVYRGLYFGMYDSIKPVLLVGPLEGSFLASFLLGWGVTTGAGIASYPLDTIRRRMMMTSGEAVKYKSSFDAGRQIMAAEGIRSFFKGAGANILRGVAGAGVLSIYDRKFIASLPIGTELIISQRLSCSSSERPSRAVPAKRITRSSNLFTQRLRKSRSQDRQATAFPAVMNGER